MKYFWSVYSLYQLRSPLHNNRNAHTAIPDLSYVNVIRRNWSSIMFTLSGWISIRCWLEGVDEIFPFTMQPTASHSGYGLSQCCYLTLSLTAKPIPRMIPAPLPEKLRLYFKPKPLIQFIWKPIFPSGELVMLMYCANISLIAFGPVSVTIAESSLHSKYCLNILRPRQNDRHFTYNNL